MLCQRGEAYRPDSGLVLSHSHSSSPALNEDLKQSKGKEEWRQVMQENGDMRDKGKLTTADLQHGT